MIAFRLLALAATLSADDEPRRRLATGALRRGAGNATRVFGGGGRLAEVKAQRRARRSLDSCLVSDGRGGHARDRLANACRDTVSNGQMTWLSTNVFAHTRLRTATGVFVEFGARDGRFESNTWTFEKTLGWSGLLIEAGRDYIEGLREMRACRVKRKPGACVWLALDARDDETHYWFIHDQVKPTMRAGQEGAYPKQVGRATVEDRAVRTRRLSAVLKRFDVAHIDFLSADCEGCETAALASLDFVSPTVDVLTVEHPDCTLLKRLAAAGYVLLPISFSQDVVFVHKRIASQMPAPDLGMPAPGQGSNIKATFAHVEALLLRTLAACPEAVVWREGEPWPPPLVA